MRLNRRVGFFHASHHFLKLYEEPFRLLIVALEYAGRKRNHHRLLAQDVDDFRQFLQKSERLRRRRAFAEPHGRGFADVLQQFVNQNHAWPLPREQPMQRFASRRCWAGEFDALAGQLLLKHAPKGVGGGHGRADNHNPLRIPVRRLMIQRNQRMGFAVAGRRLNIQHWLAALSEQPLFHSFDHPFQRIRHIGLPEKFRVICVPLRGSPFMHIP